MNKYESDFIANLIYYRELRGYTQSVLAGLCDRTKGNIGVIESGKSAPSFEMILKIADALEIHPADLFLRNASQSREDVRKFFDEELSPKVQEMVEKRFPVTENKEWLSNYFITIKYFLLYFINNLLYNPYVLLFRQIHHY